MPSSDSPLRVVELPFKVQTYDIDFAGIVSNIVYIRWLEDLRLRMLEVHFPLDRAMGSGISPVLLHTHIEYKQAIRMFDKPIGRMWMSGTGRVRGRLAAEFLVDGRVAAAAEQSYCFVDSASLRPVPLPGELRAEAGQATRAAARLPIAEDPFKTL